MTLRWRGRRRVAWCLGLVLLSLAVSSVTPQDAGSGSGDVTTTAPEATSSPATTEPTSTTSVPASTTSAPITTKPATTSPATTSPATTSPATTSPATTSPATTSPATTRPATTRPATTSPATTSPATTSPATTSPATTRPATTRPATTSPATTKPATTRPATTSPATTSPATTSPSTTAPTATTKTPTPTTTSTSTPITTSPTSTTAPSATTSSPAATTAAPAVKHYNSSTLPPDVDSSVLNGTELDTVEVTETTEASGTTSYSYTIVTTDGETKTVYINASSSSDSNTGDDNSGTQSSSTSSKSSGLGVGAIVGIIAGALVFMLVLFVFFALKRRRSKNRLSDAASDDVFELPTVGKQVRLLQNGMSLAETEYQEITRTTANSRSSGGSSRRYQSTLWEDPVITAARIPIDNIEVGTIISRGGFGEVYRGRYRDQDVAIKTLLPEKRKDLQCIQAFLSEVRLMTTMEHPNIVEFIGVAWESLSDLYCVTEYMGGGDLRSLLKDYQLTGVRQGMDASKMQIAYHVAHALTYLHSLEPVVLHRDLKSRNILLTASLHAKITDFGTSRIRSDATMTAGVGSSFWMAPEVMVGKRYDEKADVFSLGVVMSELDTHEMPYSHAKEPSDSNSGGRTLPDTAILQMVSTGQLHVRFSRFLDPEMARFAATCVSLDPRERPTAAEVLYYLQVAIRNQQY